MKTCNYNYKLSLHSTAHDYCLDPRCHRSLLAFTTPFILLDILFTRFADIVYLYFTILLVQFLSFH
ncbi:hypothetical protein A0H76_945 [Hepatospora eriocheir]|uniref:Uncharacterized protein n=1 Tax=Hepatospora eriocheir TaxID=1081669 RepID=A0A1X0QHX4_9MICR|nr:hypothetical protein A0H76_945 [Hepatospora eriocheir]